MTKREKEPVSTEQNPELSGNGDNSAQGDFTLKQADALGANLHQYPIILGTPTRSLPCKLTNKEIVSKCKELVKVVRELNEEEQRQEDEKKQMKARLSGLVDRMHVLARIVDKGEEDRPVELIIEAQENDLVQEIRQDTGEIINSRSIQDAERQLVMQQLNASKNKPRD